MPASIIILWLIHKNEGKRHNHYYIKKINREKVYQYIYREKQTSKLQIVQDLQMGLSTVSQNLNAIWQDYLKHLAFAMRNLNMIIDSPIIISGYLAPYLVQEDLDQLLHLINENNPFTLSSEQLLVGTHGQYTPAIRAALHYINRFVHEGTAL